MPVWHARTRDLVAAGKLRVLGITQEQHPERCRLFLQWHGIDWPVLWDPFNLTGSRAVPNFTLVDAHGVVRVPRARSTEQLTEFLAASFEAPANEWRPTKGPRDLVVQALGNEPTDDVWGTLSGVLWDRARDPSPLVDALRGGDDAARLFRLGVALRMRHDSAFARAGDFQLALEAWHAALRARPDQYVWRRRIQQYGPRPDKPYPFYDWVDRARRDVEARGETPVSLPVPLTAAERNAWRDAASTDAEPDPDRLVPTHDSEPFLVVETAVAWDTSGTSQTGRLHVRVRPLSRELGAWTTDGTPLVAWIANQRLEVPVPLGSDDDTGSVEPVLLECDVKSSGADRQLLRGYVLAPLCRKADGACVVVRQGFDVPLRR